LIGDPVFFPFFLFEKEIIPGFLIKCNISDRLFAKPYLYWTLTGKRLQALLGARMKEAY